MTEDALLALNLHPFHGRERTHMQEESTSAGG
jgi:hypothetical protein